MNKIQTELAGNCMKKILKYPLLLFSIFNAKEDVIVVRWEKNRDGKKKLEK